MPEEELLEAYEREARRVYLRYAIEFVEGLNLCPWAISARENERSRVEVLAKSEPSPEDALPYVERISADESLEVGLLVFPRLSLNRREFERFVARLRDLDSARYGIDGPAMAMAAFHPEAEPRFGNAYQLVPFIRRSPDPTIQLIRRTTLDSVRKKGGEGTAWIDLSKISVDELLKSKAKAKPPLHERIAENNREILLELGIERAEELLREIHEDRDRSYRAIEQRFEKKR